MLAVGKSKQLVGERTVSVKVDLDSSITCEDSSL